ncbi:MAG: hypothetical protein WCE79_30075 [Xanthobacteraceae bacterium]
MFSTIAALLLILTAPFANAGTATFKFGGGKAAIASSGADHNVASNAVGVGLNQYELT